MCASHNRQHQQRCDDEHRRVDSGEAQRQQAEEIQRLRKELADTQKERDFLKKAAVWLAKEAH